jgi:hypothetical protein
VDGGVDGGPTVGQWSVTCGAEDCLAPFVCCMTKSGETCAPQCNDGMGLKCRKPTDCGGPTGGSCCLEKGQTLATECRSACTNGDQRLCDTGGMGCGGPVACRAAGCIVGSLSSQPFAWCASGIDSVMVTNMSCMIQ